MFRTKDQLDNTVLVMPSSLKEKALLLNNDLSAAGHKGIARTKARAKDKFYWHGFGQDVMKNVTTCAICNKNKKSDRQSNARISSECTNGKGPFRFPRTVTKNT